MQALSSSDAPAIDASISSLFREKKPTLTIYMGRYRRRQVFSKRPRDIRQWFEQVAFVKVTGSPLLAFCGGQYYIKSDCWNIYGKKFDGPSIFILKKN